MLCALLSGCTAQTAPDTGPVEVAVPDAGPDGLAACAALVAALPDEVDPGVRRRPVIPDDGRAAAWGDPPVTLECGVPPIERAEPPILVNGVGFTTRDVGAATRWTTYGRSVRAAVTVPDEYANGVELIYPLAAPVAATLPQDPSAPPLVGPASPATPTPGATP